MKIVSKGSALLIICLFLATASLLAQLKPGMLMEGHFKTESTTYVAQIMTVSGNKFTCRFVQSWAEYTFVVQNTGGDLTGSIGTHIASVEVSKNPKYPKGTPFTYVVYTPSMGPCQYQPTIPSMNVRIVKFPDGKSFLGDATRTDSGFDIRFRHSGNVYGFDENGKVTRSGGVYKKGTSATIFCASSVSHQK